MTIEWTDTTEGGIGSATPATELHIIGSELPKFELWVAGGFMIEFSRRPNRWHRFWQRALLGFEWREVNE